MKDISKLVGKRKFLVGFSNLFPDEAPLTLMEYLGNFSKKDVLLAATYLAGLKTRKSEHEDNHKFLSHWFNAKNVEFFQKLDNRLSRFENSIDIPVVIFNPISSLQIFEFAFNELNDDNITNDNDLEINLIKAYLTLNENINNLEYLTIESIKKVEEKLKWSCLNFCSNFSKYEFLHHYLGETSAVQIIKAVYFFEFLSSIPKTIWILDVFLKFHGQENWKSYLKSYIPITHSIIKKTKEGYLDITVSQGENYDKDCRFLDNFIIQDSLMLDEFDFRSVRINPLYKVGEGEYRIVYDLFAIEKIFSSLYFEFYKIYESQKDLQNVGEFRRFYTSNFSENYLLYKTLKSCFHKKYIHITGEEFRSKGLSGEPDYYIRNKNKIFLFENKDVLIAAPIKQSCDFRKLEPELKKRFYFEEKDGKKKNGAVIQLINNIKIILRGEFNSDKDINVDYVSIYPILVLHYNQYNTPGLNQIINYWFQEELKNLKSEGLDTSGVQVLTIIDIDTLILLQDYLKNRQIILEHLIAQYAKEMKSKLYIIPFSNLIMNFAIKNKFYKSPAILQEFGLKLFE